MPRVTLVIPCYDEAERLQDDVFLAYLKDHEELELVFVNDGSRDTTLERIEALRERLPERIEVLDQQPNRGKAEAVRRGLLRALERPSELVGYWDADLATPLEELEHFLAIAAEEPEREIFTGARVGLLGRAIERDLLRHYLGRIFATVASATLRLSVYDTQCGAKLFRHTPAVEAIFREPFHVNWTFDVEILARFAAAERTAGRDPADRIYEVPLLRWKDVEGSKVRPFDFFVAMRELWTIRRRVTRARRPPESRAGRA